MKKLLKISLLAMGISLFPTVYSMEKEDSAGVENKQPKQKTMKESLEDLRRILRDSNQTGLDEFKNETDMTSQDASNGYSLLHLTVVEITDVDERTNVAVWLITHYPALASQADNKGKTPLQLAGDLAQKEFLQALLPHINDGTLTQKINRYIQTITELESGVDKNDDKTKIITPIKIENAGPGEKQTEDKKVTLHYLLSKYPAVLKELLLRFSYTVTTVTLAYIIYLIMLSQKANSSI
jgi:hypothetical protein